MLSLCPSVGLWSRNTAFFLDAADFDGTNDYMTRGASLTGIADSKQGLISFWIKPAAAGLQNFLHAATTVGGPTSRFVARVNADFINIRALNAAGTPILELNSVTLYSAMTGSWKHVLASWDLNTVGARHLYINDASDFTVTTFTNDTIDYTVADWAVGAQASGGNKFNGDMAEMYFTGTYLDITSESNRRKFISATGKPVNLGTDGSAPTGAAPLVYQHLADGEAVANFATNRGSGGDFTITGTLDTASTSPSD